MPTRPARVCAAIGCPTLVYGATYCAAHRQPRTFTRATGGYDRTWRRIVADAIAHQPWCTECGATEDLTGDHRISLQRGGTNTRENCEVLCRSCNSRKGGR